MKTTMRFFSLCSFFLFAQWSLEARAQGVLKINGGLLDTEAARAWSVTPSAEFSFITAPKSAWGALSQLRLPLNRSNSEPTAQLNVLVKEASLFYRSKDQLFTLGRILVRPYPTSFNEQLKGFLLSEPSADGVRYSSEDQSVLWSMFAGGPMVLGGAVAYNLANATFSFVYRGERDKLFYFPQISSDGVIAQSPRSSHTHEAEIMVQVKTQKNHVEALLQLMQQGAQRRVMQRDFYWGDLAVGEIDAELPRSNSEYRVAVQSKHLLVEQGQQSEKLVFSWASRTSSRIHDGTENERFFRQGGGNDSQFTLAIESNEPTHSIQLGTSFEYSATPKYLIFSKRNDFGESKLVKGKSQLWMSTRIKF